MNARPYTAIVLRPDYTAETYGQDTYLTWVNADTSAEAADRARGAAAAVDKNEGNEEDYFLVALFEGKLIDLAVNL